MGKWWEKWEIVGLNGWRDWDRKSNKMGKIRRKVQRRRNYNSDLIGNIKVNEMKKEYCFDFNINNINKYWIDRIECN